MKPLSVNNKKRNGFAICNSFTPTHEPSVVQYFNEIKNYSVESLTFEEEQEIFRKIHMGDEAAKEKIIKSNLKFVVSVAKVYQNQGLAFEDLINEGNVGLIKAVDKYDPTKGVKFLSYAVWWIRQSILQSLTDKGKSIVVPSDKRELLRIINKTISKLEQKLHRKPSVDEICNNIGKVKNKIVKPEVIGKLLNNEIQISSLDAPLNNSKPSDDEGTLYDLIPANGISSIPKIERITNEIDNLLKCLTEQERNIIEMDFGLFREKKFTLEEISKFYFISSERIRQIRDTALEKLRYDPNVKILFDYTIEE